MLEPTPQMIRLASARSASALLTDKPAESGSNEALGGRARRDEDVDAGLRTSQYFDVFTREVPARSASWSIWWSDLMMTMFIMFAALYAFQMPRSAPSSTSNLSVPPVAAASGRVISADPVLDRIHAQLADAIEHSGLRGLVTLDLVPDTSIHLVVSGGVIFPSGGAGLKPGIQRGLRELALIMSRSPYDLAVVGHCAPGELNSGAAGTWALSVARAGAVVEYLSREEVFPVERMYIVGYGDQRPVNSQPGRDQTHADRRVELVLGTVNITAPLARVDDANQGGFRKWLGSSLEGEE